VTEQPSPVTEATPELPAIVAETPAPAAELKAKPAPAGPYYWGTGRRKTAVARVRVKSGSGAFTVNDRKLDDFFCIERDRASIRRPLEVTETAKQYDVFVNVKGGGLTGQTGAVVLGLARALVAANPDYEPKLREFNLLTRDARKVERKKYGRAGARKRFQFSKR